MELKAVENFGISDCSILRSIRNEAKGRWPARFDGGAVPYIERSACGSFFATARCFASAPRGQVTWLSSNGVRTCGLRLACAGPLGFLQDCDFQIWTTNIRHAKVCLAPVLESERILKQFPQVIEHPHFDFLGHRFLSPRPVPNDLYQF